VLRRLVISLAVLAALLTALDRIAVHVAESLIAKRIASYEHLDHRPKVTIGGFPFLTQAVGGRYDSVKVAFYDLHRGPVEVDVMTADLMGVHVPLSAVLSQHVHTVPVDRATASIHVSFAVLNAYLAARHLRVGAATADSVRVSGPAGLSGTGRLSVQDSEVVVTAGVGLSFAIPLPGLPFHVQFLQAGTDQTGITVAATVTHLVLRTGA
jgi:hypothetical protein